MINKLLVGAALASLSFSTAAIGQGQAGRAIVSIYHAAPGQQEALIKWLAQQDRLAAEAGVPPAQLYVHTDGADWDYLIIQPVTTDAQDAAIEAAAKRLGIPQGPRAGLEFRKNIQSHSDTFVSGPTSATDYLAAIGPK